MNAAQAGFCKMSGARYIGEENAALNAGETTAWAARDLLRKPNDLDWFAIAVKDFSDLRREAKACGHAAWHAYGSLSSTCITPLKRLNNPSA